MGVRICVRADRGFRRCPCRRRWARDKGNEGVGASLLLPPVCFGMAGQPARIHFENVALLGNSQAFRRTATRDLGTADPQGCTAIPAANDVGDHPLTITVAGVDGRKFAVATTVFRVMPANAGAGRPL